MKKNLLFAMAAIGMLAGCAKEPVEVQGPEIDDTTQEVISFGVQSPSVEITKTKSLGSVDEWKEHALHVYGIARLSDPLQRNYASDVILMDNVAVNAPVAGSGALIVPEHEVAGKEPKNEPFYYQGSDLYDFYGYYVDDAELGEIVKGKDAITAPLTITGGQDIMLAKAVPAEDVKGTVLSAAAEKAYSAYSSRRGVTPTLKFEHQLAKFNFKIVSGAAGAENVQVDKLVMRAKNEGTLTLVGEQLGIVPDVKFAETTIDKLPELTLMQYTSEDNHTLVSLQALKPNKDIKANPKTLGAGLMVIPGQQKYQIDLTLSNPSINTAIEPQTIILDAEQLTGAGADASLFEAGKQYNVTITIYGLEDIEVKAELVPWTEGGDFEYDPDKGNEEIVPVEYKDLTFAKAPKIEGGVPKSPATIIVTTKTSNDTGLPQIDDVAYVTEKNEENLAAKGSIYRITELNDPKAQYDITIGLKGHVVKVAKYTPDAEPTTKEITYAAAQTWDGLAFSGSVEVVVTTAIANDVPQVDDPVTADGVPVQALTIYKVDAGYYLTVGKDGKVDAYNQEAPAKNTIVLSNAKKVEGSLTGDYTITVETKLVNELPQAGDAFTISGTASEALAGEVYRVVYKGVTYNLTVAAGNTTIETFTIYIAPLPKNIVLAGSQKVENGLLVDAADIELTVTPSVEGEINVGDAVAGGASSTSYKVNHNGDKLLVLDESQKVKSITAIVTEKPGVAFTEVSKAEHETPNTITLTLTAGPAATNPTLPEVGDTLQWQEATLHEGPQATVFGDTFTVTIGGSAKYTITCDANSKIATIAPAN